MTLHRLTHFEREVEKRRMLGKAQHHARNYGADTETVQRIMSCIKAKPRFLHLEPEELFIAGTQVDVTNVLRKKLETYQCVVAIQRMECGVVGACSCYSPRDIEPFNLCNGISRAVGRLQNKQYWVAVPAEHGTFPLNAVQQIPQRWLHQQWINVLAEQQRAEILAHPDVALITPVDLLGGLPRRGQPCPTVADHFPTRRTL